MKLLPPYSSSSISLSSLTTIALALFASMLPSAAAQLPTSAPTSAMNNSINSTSNATTGGPANATTTVPTAAPTPAVAGAVTPTAAANATSQPTAAPTAVPTAAPTASPTAAAASPTAAPAAAPTAAATTPTAAAPTVAAAAPTLAAAAPTAAAPTAAAASVSNTTTAKCTPCADSLLTAYPSPAGLVPANIAQALLGDAATATSCGDLWTTLSTRPEGMVDAGTPECYLIQSIGASNCGCTDLPNEVPPEGACGLCSSADSVEQAQIAEELKDAELTYSETMENFAGTNQSQTVTVSTTCVGEVVKAQAEYMTGSSDAAAVAEARCQAQRDRAKGICCGAVPTVPPTASPVIGPTAEEEMCSICPEGMELENPDLVVSIDGTNNASVTCARGETNAALELASSPTCLSFREQAGAAGCTCKVSTATPNSCSICPLEGSTLSNPDFVTISGGGANESSGLEETCSFREMYTALEDVDSLRCGELREEALALGCNCTAGEPPTSNGTADNDTDTCSLCPVGTVPNPDKVSSQPDGSTCGELGQLVATLPEDECIDSTGDILLEAGGCDCPGITTFVVPAGETVWCSDDLNNSCAAPCGLAGVSIVPNGENLGGTVGRNGVWTTVGSYNITFVGTGAEECNVTCAGDCHCDGCGQGEEEQVGGGGGGGGAGGNGGGGAASSAATSFVRSAFVMAAAANVLALAVFD